VKRLVGAGLGMTALSRRLVSEDLSRGTLKLVKVPDWPLQRTLRLVRLRDVFVSKAVQHFLQLVRKRIREARFVETAPGS
jgi:DNA-binding transcriptional LysR family regulator